MGHVARAGLSKASCCNKTIDQPQSHRSTNCQPVPLHVLKVYEKNVHPWDRHKIPQGQAQSEYKWSASSLMSFDATNSFSLFLLRTSRTKGGHRIESIEQVSSSWDDFQKTEDSGAITFVDLTTAAYDTLLGEKILNILMLEILREPTSSF